MSFEWMIITFLLGIIIGLIIGISKSKTEIRHYS